MEVATSVAVRARITQLYALILSHRDFLPLQYFYNISMILNPSILKSFYHYERELKQAYLPGYIAASLP
jgi:hypothetical protein